MEIQNLVVKLKQQPIKPTNFYLSTSSANINCKIVENKEKTLFWGHMCPKEIFTENYDYTQLQGSPSI